MKKIIARAAGWILTAALLMSQTIVPVKAAAVTLKTGENTYSEVSLNDVDEIYEMSYNPGNAILDKDSIKAGASLKDGQWLQWFNVLEWTLEVPQEETYNIFWAAYSNSDKRAILSFDGAENEIIIKQSDSISADYSVHLNVTLSAGTHKMQLRLADNELWQAIIFGKFTFCGGAEKELPGIDEFSKTLTIDSNSGVYDIDESGSMTESSAGLPGDAYNTYIGYNNAVKWTVELPYDGTYKFYEYGFWTEDGATGQPSDAVRTIWLSVDGQSKSFAMPDTGWSQEEHGYAAFNLKAGTYDVLLQLGTGDLNRYAAVCIKELRIYGSAEISAEENVSTAIEYYNSEGEPTGDISDVAYAGGSAVITNPASQYSDAKYIIAAYTDKACSSLLEVAWADFALQEDGSYKAEMFPYELPQGTYAVKEFVWNTGSMKPISNAFAHDVNIVITEGEYSTKDETYMRFIGRSEQTANGRGFNFPQAGLEFTFTGTEAALNVTNTLSDDEHNNTAYFNVVIDGGERQRIRLVTGKNIIAAGLANEKHTVTVLRSSEAVDGAVWIDKLMIKGGVPAPTAAASRTIEFYGDSFTVGYGDNTAECSALKCALNTDTWNSYAGITARTLGAEASIIAYSAMGLHTNYFGVDSRSIENQFRLSDIRINVGDTHSEWDFEKEPDIAVVFVGTNDNNGDQSADKAQTFTEHYESFINNLRAVYPNAHILLLSAPQTTVGNFEPEITSLYNRSFAQDAKIHRHVLKNFANTGLDYHPTAEQQQAIAAELVEVINEISPFAEGK